MEVIIDKVKTKNILSKSNLPVCDYSANPYVGCPHACKYCYASFMKRFTAHSEPWGSFLDVKYWPEIDRLERYAGKGVFIGSVTDPYNPYEQTYQRTRALLEQLRGSGAEICIATKSDLVLRDLELIKSFPNARVSWSINTLDEGFRSDMDEAVSIERRLSAMKEFHDAGVCTTCFISPIFPGITDVPSIITRARSQCSLIWLENLNLRGNFKSGILDYIKSRHSELLPLYEGIYLGGNKTYWKTVDDDVRRFVEGLGLSYLRDDDSIQRSPREPIVVNYFYHELIKRTARAKGIEALCKNFQR